MTDLVPVGIVEIASRLGVGVQTVQNWRSDARRNTDFPPPTWTVGGRPAWDWQVIKSWAEKTGRL